MPTGELKLFEHLYEQQNGLCAVSGRALYPPGHALFHHQGSHLLPKGTYPELRLLPRNVVMILPAYHLQWHTTSKDELFEIHAWRPIIETYRELRLEAHAK